MKCENCGNELVGASIVCRQCNSNITQGRVGQWRARHNNVNPAVAQAQAIRTISPLPAPKPELKKQPIESGKAADTSSFEPRLQPARFEPKQRISQASLPKTAPAKSSAASSTEDESGVVQFPAWRAQLKDKVKEVRDRRTNPMADADTEPDEAQLDPNPIVESALKRIRWSQHITPQSPDESNKTEAQPVQNPKPGIETQPESKPLNRVEPKPEFPPSSRISLSSNPLLARKPASQPIARTEPAPRSVPKPEPISAPLPEIEDRVEIKPVPPPAPKPGSGSLTSPATKPGSGQLTAPSAKTGSGSLTSLPKVRTTGEIKKPATPPQPAPQRTPSGSLVQPPRNPVETKVIGLNPSVSNLPGFDATGAYQALKPRNATLWGRTLAGACDFEIVAMAFLPIFWPYAVLNTSIGYESVAVMFVLLASLMFCYQLLTLSIANRTTGMAFLRLRLVNSANKEKPVTFLQKLLRALSATAVSFIPPLNFLVIQSNPQHRSLPDLISGTMLLERVKAS